MKNIAPILIITLNRYEHFKRCIDSLALCTDAAKTVLFIAIDYPLKESHWAGYNIINQYINCIKGFKKVIIIKRTENYGPQKNLFDAFSKIFNENDRLIYAEDDNVFAPSFINFVNSGLNTYESRSDIFAVSGYNMPIKIPDWYHFDSYLIQGYTAWGVGIWRDKFNHVDWSLDNYNAMLFKKENYKKLKKHYQQYLPGLLKNAVVGARSDGFLFLYLLDKNMYSIYPVKSRVRNIGHDGSGEHGGYSDLYVNQKLHDSTEVDYFPPDLQPDKDLLATIKKYHQLGAIKKIIRLVPESVRIRLRKIVKNNRNQ